MRARNRTDKIRHLAGRALALAHNRRARHHVLQGLKELLVATVAPLLIFSLFQVYFSTTLAIISSAGWALCVTTIEVAWRRRVSGLLVLSLATLAVRAASGLATGSSFVFFAVPCGGTAATGALFAWSGNWHNPLLTRLAHDVVPFMGSHLATATSRTFVSRLSWTWGFAYIMNAVGSFLLLVFTPLHAFMFLHVLESWLCSGLAAAVTVLLVKRHGPHLLAALRASIHEATPEETALASQQGSS